MSCPYQFYASACLKLSKTEELKEDIDKADFGSLVHKCIYAFFIQFPDAPSPFDKKITEDNRKDAETVLNSISEYIFNKYTDGNFYGTLWLQRWLNLIPSFISWELQRQEKYNIYKHEASLQKTIKTCVTLKGRVDRIDQSTDGYAIVDYKTAKFLHKKMSWRVNKYNYLCMPFCMKTAIKLSMFQ